MTANDKIIRNKLGLLNLAEELGNVSKACKVMGFFRDTLVVIMCNYVDKAGKTAELITDE